MYAYYLGMTKETIKVDVDEFLVTVSGDKKKKVEKSGCKFHKEELVFGTFTRSIKVCMD